MSTIITNNFETSSAAAWKQKIQFELNGADYNETLLIKTNEGITINPFYHADNFEKITIPETASEFKFCQKINITSEENANNEALKAVSKGVNSLKFNAIKPFNTTQLFEKLLNKNIDFHFNLGFLSTEFSTNLLETLKNENVFLNIDIIGNLAKKGNWHVSLNNNFNIVETLLQLKNTAHIISVNANLYQNAGANIVQQVAYALAHANEYLTKFGGEIAPKIQFNLAIGNNYFFEIAKIRAFKYLYNLILNEYNTNCSPLIFAEPSLRNKTLYNYSINTQRATTECMSAIIGGATTITNNSFNKLKSTENVALENESDNELNYFINLKKEGKLNHLEHLSTDSYYIETITKQITEKALTIFKEIEKGGGFLQQLKEGTIQRKILENAKREQLQFNKNELILVGSNKHIIKTDFIKTKLYENPFSTRNPQKTLIIPIISKRLSEKLEQNRLKNEA